MRVTALRQNDYIYSVNDADVIDKDFQQILQSTYGNRLSEELKEKTQASYYKVECNTYTKNIIDISQCSDKAVDTGRYQIQRKDGNVRIYDKQTQGDFGWILRYGAEVQVDEKSGQKFLMNDFGNGFFMMQYVDEELENGLKEFFELEELPEKELNGFTVQTDTVTGIQYVTANGYEWQGGHIIFTDAARTKLNALTETYMKEYPGRLKSYDEAFFYASFEVRGLAKRTSDGILMLGQDNIIFKGKNEKDDWTIFFESQLWEMIKSIFDGDAKGNGDIGNQAGWKIMLGKVKK